MFDAKNPWEWVKIINGTLKVPEDEIIDSINSYDIFMVNRIFSNVPQLTKLTELANTEGYTKLMHFNMIRSACRAKFGNSTVYVDYPKSKEKDDKNIDLISKYYEISKKTAKDYLKLISKEELIKIIEYYELIDSFTKISKTKLSKKDME